MEEEINVKPKKSMKKVIIFGISYITEHYGVV